MTQEPVVVVVGIPRDTIGLFVRMVTMEAEDLHEKVKHQPFEPFCIYVSDGTVYEVKHPEQIMVGKRSSYVGIRRNGDGPFQKIAIVSNMHITRIEPLTQKKNGKGRSQRG